MLAELFDNTTEALLVGLLLGVVLVIAVIKWGR